MKKPKVYKIKTLVKSMSKDRGVELGMMGVTFGILSILFSLNQPLPGIVSAIIGLTFSMKQEKVERNKWSRNGKILSIIGLVLGILMFIVTLVLLSNPGIVSQIPGGY